eukprot:2839189-Rhodomonas_salina.1
MGKRDLDDAVGQELEEREELFRALLRQHLPLALLDALRDHLFRSQPTQISLNVTASASASVISVTEMG